MVAYIGYLAAILTTIAYIPQVIKSHRSKKLKDISLNMYLLMTSGVLLWLAYGVLIKNMPLIVANGVTGLFSLYILYLKIKNG